MMDDIQELEQTWRRIVWIMNTACKVLAKRERRHLQADLRGMYLPLCIELLYYPPRELSASRRGLQQSPGFTGAPALLRRLVTHHTSLNFTK
ncbi:hypothetical protein GN244_ATG17756 [Phytophthora infestans]|uniref:Uncharacterized protein n=1 Tax=Phytophthora infestans TaxID=4787 RepID=A0A833WKU4_PHYIN|nr:hypothetical protein GN244_ATG17756 [Phytophthora infestans]